MKKVIILLDWKIEMLIQVKQSGYEFRKEIPKQRRPQCGGSKSLCTNESESRSVMSNSLWSHGLYSPWNSPGQNTGVCSLSLLQGIFPTQGLNPGLRHCRWILYQLSHKGTPPTPHYHVQTGLKSWLTPKLHIWRKWIQEVLRKVIERG